MNSHDPSTNEALLELKRKLNLETGQMDWPELQAYFARGIVIVVKNGHDLIETAHKIHADEKIVIQTMIHAGDIIRANDEHARDWQNRQPLFWSVVIAPWLLVQEKGREQ